MWRGIVLLSLEKKLADGCVMSRLTYGIQIWGLSINKHLWKKIQRVQNLVMCWVLSRPFWTKITGLLDEMNWLSMFELSCYHSLLLLWKLKIIRLRTITFLKILKSKKITEEKYNWQEEYGVLELLSYMTSYH